MTIQASLSAADKKVIASLGKSFKTMERKLTAILIGIKHDEDDLLVRDVANINKTNKLLDRLNKEMSKEAKAIYESQISGLKKITKAILQESQDIGMSSRLFEVTKEEAKAFMTGITEDMAASFEGALQEANDLIRGSVSGTLNFEKASEAISNKLDIRLHQAETLASTSLMNFQRSIMTTQADEADVEWFAYLGPNDTHTREFCSRLEGKRYTLQQLEALSGSYGRNPGLIPVSMWLGGYDCRHRLAPLVDDKDIQRYKIGPKGRKGKQ